MSPPSENLKTLIISLWDHISRRRRMQVIGLIFLMVLAAFAEVLSLGALLPFLAVLVSPEKLFSYSKIQILFQWMDFKSSENFLGPMTAIFCFVVIAAGMSRLLMLWAITKFSFGLGADLSVDIYRKILYQPYIFHISRNSSELMSSIAVKTNDVISHIIHPLLLVFSSAIILTAILLLLGLVDIKVTCLTFFGFSLIYLVIVKLTKSQLVNNAKKISADSSRLFQSLQEGLGGIKDVLLGASQEVYIDIYRRADLTLRKAQASNLFVSSSPRFIIESWGIVLIALIAFSLTGQDSYAGSTVLLLGVFALAAQRMLPILQTIYHSLANMHGNQESLRAIVNLLNQHLPELTIISKSGLKPMDFNRSIEFEKLSFRYSESSPWVLRDIDLTIGRGERIGFIGATGCGKSTLIDVVMALLTPTSGLMRVDGIPITDKNFHLWQLNIAHVPQFVFFIDASIAENIAFGVRRDEIDFNRVRSAARQAQISQTIESWADSYNTQVGERGVKLSGGQRQRVAIARALYKQANVIIFDEATSALDGDTEQAVMSSVEALSKDITLIMIAHRLTTLKNCTQIVELGDGTIKRTGSYKEIIH